jgi:hypothetical protein
LCFHYTGSIDELKALIATAGDILLPIGQLRGAPFWTLAARVSLVAEQADLIADADTTVLLDDVTALANAVGQGEVADGPDRPLYRHATRAMCALAGRGTAGQAQHVLDLLASHVHRPENHYDITDDWHADACLTIAWSHPSLRGTAIMRLLDLAAGHADRAVRLLGNTDVPILIRTIDETETALHTRNEQNTAAIIARLTEIAATGQRMAQLALAEVKPDHPDVATYALAARDQILGRPQAVPNTASIGTGLTTLSGLVRFLSVQDRQQCVDKLLSVATDRNEPALNRQEALTALRGLSADLPEPARARVFAMAQQFASGTQDGSALDDFTAIPHPLSAIRINLGSASLRGHGLLLATAVATAPDEYAWARTQIQDLLGSTDGYDLSCAALAATWLPAQAIALDPRTLSTHPVVALRQLAARLWARNPGTFADVGARLVSDSDPDVRRHLANVLRHIDCHDAPGLAAVGAVQETLHKDRRYSVRKLVPPID